MHGLLRGFRGGLPHLSAELEKRSHEYEDSGRLPRWRAKVVGYRDAVMGGPE